MQDVETRMLQVFRRADYFLEVVGVEARRPTVSPLRRQLREIIATIEELALLQETSTAKIGTETLRIRQLRRAIKEEHMRPISRAARALIGRGPAETIEFHVAAGRPSPVALIAAAGTMATQAEPHAALFISHGLSADFLDRLHATVEALQTAIQDRGASIGHRAGAVAGVAAAVSDGRAKLAFLNAIMLDEFRDDPDRLAEWRNAIRFVRRPGPRGRGSREGDGGAGETSTGPGEEDAPGVS